MAATTNGGAFEAGCLGKKSFASMKQAWVAARRRKGRRAYRCKFCGQCHVGSTQLKRRKFDDE